MKHKKEIAEVNAARPIFPNAKAINDRELWIFQVRNLFLANVRNNSAKVDITNDRYSNDWTISLSYWMPERELDLPNIELTRNITMPGHSTIEELISKANYEIDRLQECGRVAGRALMRGQA
ncbi:MAG: hypothetical protein AB8B85_02765 [Paracoccaceae bacterium]